MRKLFLFGFIGLSTVLLSSCGMVNNLMTNQNQNQTSVVLSQANYKVVGTASGKVKNCYVLGFGGLSKKSLRENAVGNMMKDANLQGSQAVINVNIVDKYKNYFLWGKREMKAEGTVIEFTK